mgnify:CR=1 FL=1
MSLAVNQNKSHLKTTVEIVVQKLHLIVLFSQRSKRWLLKAFLYNSTKNAFHFWILGIAIKDVVIFHYGIIMQSMIT